MSANPVLLEPLVQEERGQPERSRRLVEHDCQEDDHCDRGCDTIDWGTKIHKGIDSIKKF